MHIFQIDRSQLNIYWSSFVDVETFGLSSHHSGIFKYEYAVGEYYVNEEISVVANRLHVNVEKMYVNCRRHIVIISLFICIMILDNKPLKSESDEHHVLMYTTERCY